MKITRVTGSPERVRRVTAKRYRCDGCGTPGHHKPVVTGRSQEGFPTGLGASKNYVGVSFTDSWDYAWLCEECAQPYAGR